MGQIFGAENAMTSMEAMRMGKLDHALRLKRAEKLALIGLLEQLRDEEDEQRESEQRRQRIASHVERIEEAVTAFRSYVDLTHPGYTWGEWQEALAAILQWFSDEVLAGRSPNVVVEAPPRHGKTAQISIRLPGYHLARAAAAGLRHDVMLVSHTESLAARNSRQARAICRDLAPHVPALAPRQGDSDSATDWTVANGGRVLAGGMDGNLTGGGADVLIIDDPVKNSEDADSAVKSQKQWETYQTVLSTRVAPGGGTIVLMTRWSEDDMIGRLLEAEPGTWLRIRMPAIAEETDVGRELIPGTGICGWRREGEALDPQRFPLQRLERMQRVMAVRWWLAMYQARPTSAEGTLWRLDDLRHEYEHHPQRPPQLYDQTVLSIDANFKAGAGNADAAIVAIGHTGLTHDILGIPLQESVDFYDLVTRTMEAVHMFRPSHILIEDKANGSALISMLEKRLWQVCQQAGIQTPVVVAYNPGNTSKDARASAVIPYFREGNVRWPKHAPWKSAAQAQLLAFGPGAAKKDIADAITQALLWINTGEDGAAAVKATWEAWANFTW